VQCQWGENTAACNEKEGRVWWKKQMWICVSVTLRMMWQRVSCISWARGNTYNTKRWGETIHKKKTPTTYVKRTYCVRWCDDDGIIRRLFSIQVYTHICINYTHNIHTHTRTHTTHTYTHMHTLMYVS
jgi:hypothetical protein